MSVSRPAADPVVSVAAIGVAPCAQLLERYGLTITHVSPDAAITGSYWGAPEAGLKGAVLYCRDDTPLHSLLHEACHYVCMDGMRRAQLDRDAGGDHAEENAVCYLQILLANQLPGMSADRLLADMDAWGYTFRLGSARTWFEQDAADAREWLICADLIDVRGHPTWRLRQSHHPITL